MSERSFALGCVGVALAFGIVVPDPVKAPEPLPDAGIVMTQPVPQPAQAKAIGEIEGGPFAVYRAAPAKPDATPAFLWAARSAP